LIDAARDLMRRPVADTVGLWPRAAALLARRALEEALDELWSRRAPGLERASARAQLACLPDYLGDRELAREIVFTWGELSNACHHHAYELPLTAEELERRLGVVGRLVSRLDNGPPPPQTDPPGRRADARG
jgi:hypothetical protein